MSTTFIGPRPNGSIPPGTIDDALPPIPDFPGVDIAGVATALSASYEYVDSATLCVWLNFTKGSNCTGVHVWEEREDQSSTGGAAMDGSVLLNGSANLGGAFAPIDRGYFSESPIAVLLPRPDGPVVKRFYLAAFNALYESPLVRAGESDATPSVTVSIGAPTYQSGEEYARLVRYPTVTVEYDDSQVSSPKYRLVFAWTAPTDPPAAWQRPFGGAQIVYQYPDKSRANGPALATNETNTRSDWYDLFVGTAAIKCWFASYDASETPKVNSIVEGVTPFATATVTWPLVARPAAGVYADNVTNFTASNARYDVNGAGQKILRLDLLWTQPPETSSARWGGVVIWLHLPSGDKFQVTGAETGCGLSAEFTASPQATQAWTFYAVSIDNNNNANTDGRAPISGTPSATISVGPPAQILGAEYTSNVTGAGFSVAPVTASDGTTQQRITATFTPPADATWGGVEMRVYDGATLLGVVAATPSPIALTVPNPSSAITATVKLVSYDVNNKTNTEQAITPQGGVLIGASTGTFDIRKFLPASTDLFTVSGGKIVVDAGQIPGPALANDAVTAPKIKAGEVIAGKLAANAVIAGNIAALAVTAGTLAANVVAAGNIIAGTITSDRLYSSEIAVGGGGSKPAKFGVYNSSGSVIGFIGVSGSDEGAWFKSAGIGSTSYANAPFKADASGVVTLDFSAANNTSLHVLISQNTYDGVYTSAGIRITNGASPAMGSDTTWLVSRGLITYGASLNSLGNYYAVTCNRDPTYTNCGEVVVYGSSYVRLSGYDGTVRADGGLKVGAYKVVGARITGYTIPTGPYSRASFDTTTVTLPELAKRVAYLIEDLKTHGLLGA